MLILANRYKLLSSLIDIDKVGEIFHICDLWDVYEFMKTVLKVNCILHIDKTTHKLLNSTEIQIIILSSFPCCQQKLPTLLVVKNFPAQDKQFIEWRW